VSTTREKREAKAERYREWADGREAQAKAAQRAAQQVADGIPFGQPILVGHHSEKRHRRDIARIDSGMRATVEHGEKADSMRSRAENIERATAHAIFDDDPDARERLTAKITRLEARRDAMKAANAAFRKEHRERLATLAPYERRSAVPHQSWEITNLGATIRTAKQRLEALGRPERGRYLIARYAGECRACGGMIAEGEACTYFKRTREIEHRECPAS